MVGEPMSSENWIKAKDELMKLPFILDCACGASEHGMYILPVVRIGQEHRASEIPVMLHGIHVSVRYERDD